MKNMNIDLWYECTNLRRSIEDRIELASFEIDDAANICVLLNDYLEKGPLKRILSPSPAEEISDSEDAIKQANLIIAAGKKIWPVFHIAWAKIFDLKNTTDCIYEEIFKLSGNLKELQAVASADNTIDDCKESDKASC
jgi:hypothetical protein